ncbi:MAG: hypothetical protein MUP71_09980 [Candidatus Aminicenantes bacterium]|nr:hypothetical protein [Candidatus Aminicenantes bacterium]
MKRRNIRFSLLAAALLLSFGSGKLPAVESGPPVAAVPEFAHLSIGSGYGLNYGGIGLGFEFSPRLPEKMGTGFHKYVSFAMGLGYMPDGGLAYSFGLHLYPLGRDLFLQPRLAVQYGVVAVVGNLYSYPGDERRAEGVAFGSGFLLKLARQIFLDADVHYIIPVDYAMEELAGERLRFSAGLRYRL